MSDVKEIIIHDYSNYDVRIGGLPFDDDYYNRYLNGKNTFAEALYLQLIREYYE